ncbi:porin [Algibacillus agarilyticus]|uniref:porin n=1 Tax=Algibacillus agarilyticus TaxID=2234133 RepID=UPI0013009BD2|nr:porin [Algibacillus agarilyticus]
MDIENSQAKSVSLGLNYYLDKNLKLMAIYIKGEYVDEGVNLGSGNAFSLRVQYRF